MNWIFNKKALHICLTGFAFLLTGCDEFQRQSTLDFSEVESQEQTPSTPSATVIVIDENTNFTLNDNAITGDAIEDALKTIAETNPNSVVKIEVNYASDHRAQVLIKSLCIKLGLRTDTEYTGSPG